MRRYRIEIGAGARGNTPFTWDSYPNGKNDPNAQQVEFQIVTFQPSNLLPDANTFTIMGVAWEQINQQANLVGAPVHVFGGMAPGLPLATHQSHFYGPLASGTIYKCWGNWVGTDMSLGFSITTASDQQASSDGTGGTGGSGGAGGSAADAPQPSSAQVTSGNMHKVRFNRTGPRSIDQQFRRSGRAAVEQQDFGDFGGFGGMISQTFGDASQSIGGQVISLLGGAGGLVNPLNFIHNLQPNMPLSSSIQETLSRVFPGVPLNINISPQLKLGYQDAGAYQNFTQFASYIKDLSHSIMGTNNYSGVNMTVNGSGGIDIWDSTSSGTPKEVTVFELIGQPTWVDVGKVQFTTVMRGDLYPPQIVYLPKNIPYNIGPDNTALGYSHQRTELSFTGAFKIFQVTHNGDFRNPDGMQWSTTFDCTYLTGSELASALYNPDDLKTILGITPPLDTSSQVPATQSQTSPSRLLSRAARRL